MVKLTKIYTKTGDKGWTKLIGNKACRKNDPRIEACGTIDETNAAIGIARLYKIEEDCFDERLFAIQHDLFDLGADVANISDNTLTHDETLELRIREQQVQRLEQEMDLMNLELEYLTSFVLPGGSAAAAHLHFARTIARRAERCLVTLAEKETLNPFALHYINRLSDFLFVAARIANKKQKKDVLWLPAFTQ